MNTARQLWGRWFGDLNRAWWVVLVCSTGLALVLGFFFVLLMKVRGWVTWQVGGADSEARVEGVTVVAMPHVKQ